VIVSPNRARVIVMAEYSGKIALVGASKGIGAAGASVVVNYAASREAGAEVEPSEEAAHD